MSTITLVGAGGKMGCRIADNLKRAPDKIYYLEISPAGIERLRQRGLVPATPAEALPAADVVILAVPDVAVEAVSKEVVPQLRPGALVMLLDPAAPLDGKIARRSDLGYFVAHPCHPSVFNWEPTEASFRDFYGGISAKQSAVCALMSGDEKFYELGVAVTRAIYAPVKQIHRVTLEQMAMLEPALVETLAQTCIEIVKEGYDRVVALGVPEAAARDFVLGHLRIQIAVLFGEVNGTFSDAAYRISARARPLLFRDGWERIFELEDIRAQVRDITSTTKLGT
jgi:ketol-acid reductoisomerase